MKDALDDNGDGTKVEYLARHTETARDEAWQVWSMIVSIVSPRPIARPVHTESERAYGVRSLAPLYRFY